MSFLTADSASSTENLFAGGDGDLNEIIDGLDMSGVDELDLSQFLNEVPATRYLDRDLQQFPSQDPFNQFFIDPSTADILKPLVHATTIIPASNIVWTEDSIPMPSSSNTNQTFSQYWGNKRTYENANPTNMELPAPRDVVTAKSEKVDLRSGLANDGNEYKINAGALSGLLPEEKSDAKKRKLTSEEKQSKRKQQTRAASKLYRQRRKKLEVELAERLEQLEQEKRILVSEKKAADELLQNLREENNKLRLNQKMFSEENAKKRYDLLVRLQKQVNEGASDDILCQTIQEVKACCRSCAEIGRCNLQSIINPGSVQQLLGAGFFDTIKLDLETKGTVEEFFSKIRAEIGKMLTQEQITQMERAVAEHNERLQVLITEREKITESIQKAFRELQLQSKGNDPKDYADIIMSIEHLRKSLSDEAMLWGKTFTALIDDTLTPLQMAHFFLKVEFKHRSVVQLNTFWSALKQTMNGNGLNGPGVKPVCA